MGNTGSTQTQTASWGNRHCAESASGGKPANAVQWTAEGNFAIGNKEKIFIDALNPQLAECGVTEEEWQQALEKIRAEWAVISKTKFKKAITELNESLFVPKGCFAVYGEYGAKGGQACMTVYTKEQWESLPESAPWCSFCK